jgi:hypothetical protein
MYESSKYQKYFKNSYKPIKEELQYIHISKHQIIHLEYIQFSFVNYIAQWDMKNKYERNEYEVYKTRN